MASPATDEVARARQEDMDISRDTIVAKRGEILLQPSKDGKHVGTLLVSSVVLSLASPVFEAMFSGRFLEGQDLSAASPKNIKLPEDDPYALRLLCLITHLQTARINDSITLSNLADLAMVCDKYQCTEAITDWSKLQIARQLAKSWTPMHAKLLFVTYVLDLPGEFNQAVLHMLRGSRQTLGCEAASHGTNIIPLAILGM
jgi:hypothetical protein